MVSRLGISAERAALFGKPHIGASYANGRGRLDEDARCVICGRMASNAHHIVPKGMGGGSTRIEVAGIELLSPLFAVCGRGNTSGCHKRFHDGIASVRWEWYDRESEIRWKTGELIRELGPHSPLLFMYGCYVLTDGEREWSYER